MEYEKALKAAALLSELANTVKNAIDDFFASGVVTAGIIVSGVFLSRNQLLGMEQLLVLAGSDFIDDGRFEVDKDSTRDPLARACFTKKRPKRVFVDYVRIGQLAGGLNTMLKAVELPARVADLNASLADMDRDDFTHVEQR